jgi:hypothetical protein
VLRVTGEVDLCTLPAVQAALGQGLAARPAHLLVDLTAMTFCCARGLDLLTQTATSPPDKQPASRSAACHPRSPASGPSDGTVISRIFTAAPRQPWPPSRAAKNDPTFRPNRHPHLAITELLNSRPVPPPTPQRSPTRLNGTECGHDRDHWAYSPDPPTAASRRWPTTLPTRAATDNKSAKRLSISPRSTLGPGF